MQINYHFKAFLKTIRSTYMCIRYPFLYPRNRFTGKHYNNWKLHQYHVDNYKKAVGSLCMHVYNEKEILDKKNLLSQTYTDIDGVIYAILIDDKEKKVIFLKNGEKVLSENIGVFCEEHSDVIPRFLFIKNSNNDEPFIYVVYPDDVPLDGERRFFIYNYTKDYWLRLKIWVADFLNDYVLQLFHCIPTFTEWDAMEELRGWNKAFGKQLLKDMKKQLIKDKTLYKFRITDLKEKWGFLHLYCNAGSEEMYKLIIKYEHISERTCIECGKPAKYISRGWVCPYCEDCIGERKVYADIDEKGDIKYRD